jgi:choline dehydrogenase-like flavoprotein
MPSESHNVIVVGAGPAGASAAYWLGEAGQQVLALERDRLPRYKPCGGGVPKVVFDRFPFDFSNVIECWGRLWARLFNNYPWWSFQLAVRSPLFVKEFLRLLAGEVSYRQMAVRAFPNALLGLSRRLPVKHCQAAAAA